jgi:hypothetical protein
LPNRKWISHIGNLFFWKKRSYVREAKQISIYTVNVCIGGTADYQRKSKGTADGMKNFTFFINKRNW